MKKEVIKKEKFKGAWNNCRYLRNNKSRSSRKKTHDCKIRYCEKD